MLWLLNSIATHLGLTRFEHRLLRYFNDCCIPLFTFNVNPLADRMWRESLPPHFAALDMVRQSVYAFACLNLWRFTDVSQALEFDRSAGLIDPPDGNFRHVFESLAVFEDNGDSVFSKTAEYFASTLEKSGVGIYESQTNDDVTLLDRVFFSGTLITAFVGLHPYCIMPVVDFENDPPLDVFSFAAGLRRVFDRSYDVFKGSMIVEVDDLRLMASGHAGYKSSIVADLHLELVDYYGGLTSFAEINSQISEENRVCDHFIKLLGNCFSLAVYKGYPIPFFRFPSMVDYEIGPLARRRHPFVLRLVFVYCCICVYCGFCLLAKSNVWQRFIDHYLLNFGYLGKLERALYEYVKKYVEVDYVRFSSSIKELDVAVSEAARQITPEEIPDW